MRAAFEFVSAASVVALSAASAITGAVAVQFVAVSVAQAAVVNRVEVLGNQRVDADTVRNYITIKPGKSFSNSDIDDAVKALFGSGLFSDVRIKQVGLTLVVQVSEYKVINNVLFQGNKKLKDVALEGAVQIKSRGAFSQATLDSDAQSIKEAYKRVGRDDATVSTKVIDLGENRVNVVFEIDEGDRTKIAAINFVGNDAYSDRRLADIISTKRSSFLSFMLRDDIYDEDRLRADEERLRRFYLNHGYADFRAVSAFGELDEATNQYTITITVDEGQRYTFGDVRVESRIPEVDGARLQRLFKTRKGDVYSAKDVEDSIIAITENVASAGYAFAEVTPRGDRNFESRTISVVYTVDQGSKAYIERIEIRGNERTRDFVIRREFDISEGDAFNQVLIQRAKKRLEALNFFEKVGVSTVPGSQPNQVVLVVDLIEKSTGEFSIGVGYSTGGDNAGPSVEGSITERNFLGRGQFIKFLAGGGKNSRDYSFSFTEPYFLGSRVAAGFDVFRRNREYKNYDSDVKGGIIRFSLPITNNISTQLAYNISQEEYNLSKDCDSVGNGAPDVDCKVSSSIINGVKDSPWITSSVSGSLVYNTIDDMKIPHNGIYTNLTTEVAGLGGDAKFVKFTGRTSYYQTLSEEFDIVGLLSAGGGHIQGFGDDGLRVFDQFKSSDRMIRGFKYNGIGPMDTATNEHLGGTVYFNALAEAQFPISVIPESFGLRGAFFADAATLYGSKVSGVDFGTSTDMELRASVGVGLLWASPFGPLRIDYAAPVKKVDGDETQEFNFGISTRF